ncbi:MAG: leucine-rich repeat domain-containing protein [Clostridia bacterium]|nr:leucine-rich repeat domain-containing protein [Clostridia bacterium]
MKKKLFISLLIVTVFVFLFALSVNAEVTVYDDAPAKTNLEVRTDDLVVFQDGFCCPSAYIFKDVTETANGWKGGSTLDDVMDFSFLKTKGKSYGYYDIVSIDLPQGMTYVGGYGIQGSSNIKKISFPDTITGFGMAVLADCTSLEECVFEHDENDNLTTLCPEFFDNCPNLKSISLPDCITTFGWNQHNLDGAYFRGCTSLGAIHLPKNLQVMYGQTDGKSVFGNLPNAYFVNEPFTYDNIPQKPDVYYFPSGLTTVSGTVFRGCKNLNNILVFGQSTTSITRGWEFEEAAAGDGARPTVVFLGDMTSVNVNGWNVNAVYFANENDINASTAGVSGSATIYYCNAEGNTNHLTETSVDMPASCEVNAAKVISCFCGYETRQEVAGTALSHDYDYANSKATLVSLTYTSYTSKGKKVVACANCGVNGEFEASALFVCQGYSTPLDGRGALAIGYTINNEAIKEYEKTTNKTLKYGVFAVLKDKLGTNDIFDENGNTAPNAVTAEVSGDNYVAVEFKITGFTDTYKDLKLAMGAYVIATENEASDGEVTESKPEYSYLQAGALSENEKYSFVSYNDVFLAKIAA